MKNLNNPRVLVVDDNPFNRELLKGILEPEGFLAEEAQNGNEAMTRMKASDFQMIFMDLLMPGMDGFETIQRIRRMGIKTPIIIVSSMDSREDRQRCLEAGGNDFLAKPIDDKKVKRLIEKYQTEDSQASGDVPEPEETPEQPALNFSDYHILLVEEDDTAADRFEFFLKKARFKVTRVPNGNEAWYLFLKHRHQFNVIVSNMFIPGIDGFGILAKIKRDYADVLVFIYTQTYNADTFQLAVQLGADGVTTEPEFENAFIRLFESAIYQSAQKGSRTQSASTASQVRSAQKELIKYGCPEPCDSIDIAYSPLTDAGGDMAWCRRFNRAGRCGIALGDVAGHSVMSSYISAISLGILTSTWDKNQNPMELLKIINTELNKSDYDKYHLCATALLWDRYRRRIKFAFAGNPGGLLAEKKTDGSLNFRELEGGGMCLGLLKEDRLFLEGQILFEQGGYLFLFSDGICKDDILHLLSSGTVDLKQRKSIRGLSQEILDRILEKRGQDDDMILAAIKSPDQPETEALFRPGGDTGFVSGIHHAFRSGYEAADKACRWAACQCTPEKIPPGNDSCFIFLAVREALINAVKHGNRFNPKTFVDLSLFFKPGELRIEISDQGPGFVLPDEIQKIEDISALQSGGRGLSVMYSIADHFEVDGGTVSLIFREKKGSGRQMRFPLECNAVLSD